LPKEFTLLNKLHLKIPENLQSFNISRKKTSWLEIEEEDEEICEFNLRNLILLHFFSTFCIMAKFCTFWQLNSFTVNQLFLPDTVRRK
jgi:hypothetical protein